MSNIYRICHGFYNNKNEAKKDLTYVKKHYPDSKIEEDGDGKYAVVFKRETDYNKAAQTLHEIFKNGLWCGIETIKVD